MRTTLASVMAEGPADDDSLARANIKLQEQIKRLNSELDDARSHIFSLQPYRKELTPEEVRRVSPLTSLRFNPVDGMHAGIR